MSIRKVLAAILVAALVAGLVLFLAFIGGSFQEGGPTFTEAVETVYTPCDADKIKFRTASKGLQLAFKPCGSNNFIFFAWSPDGLKLYYQASQGGWVRKDTGENFRLRVGAPPAGPAWLNPEMLAYPDSTGRKIGIYQVSAHVLNLLEVPQVEPVQLTRGQAPDDLLYLAGETPGGAKDIYRLSVNTADSEKAFLWLEYGAESFTYAHEVDIVCYREMASDTVICARGQSGEEIVRVDGRKRGTVSKDGRYLVTEGDGEPIRVTPEGEVAPDWIPKEVVPPAFWIRDLQTGEEVLWDGVHGNNFQWYDAATYYGSFMFWGTDGHEMNRNVALVDLRSFMKGQGWEVPLPQVVHARP